MRPKAIRRVAFASALGMLSLGAKPLAPMLPLPERVSFPSADGTTSLTGYLFKPETRPAANAPAVVMMHGRGGIYSSLANGDYRAATISRRNQEWGHLWARQGYFALLVDGFGPRGYPKGFPRFSYDQRPKELDEVSVRPLDAYGALSWLRKQPGIAPEQIVLQGWSNGASATLAAMAAQEAPGLGRLDADKRISRGAGVLSGLRTEGPVSRRARSLRAGAGVHGTADEEVSPRRCEDLVKPSARATPTSRSCSTRTRCTASTIRAASARAMPPTRQRRPTPPRRRWPSLPAP